MQSKKNKKPKKNAFKTVKIVALSIAALVVIFCFALSFVYYLTLPVNKNSDKTLTFVVGKGQSPKSIAFELEQAGLIKSKELMYCLARVLKPNFKAGSYRLSKNMGIKEIFSELSTGKQAYVKLTIAEGLTLSKIAKTVEASGIAGAEEFLMLTRSGEPLKPYGIIAESCEGFLFPDTYFIPENITASELLNFLVKTFFEKTGKIENFPKDGEKIMEAVKLASIVEREYRVAEEAALIAGVFTNRLRINMALKSCATIEYIITEIYNKPHPKRIYWADLEIDNPCNTYIYEGLPPTPICSPGLVALKAAANPSKHEYLYFRLSDEATGTHNFSKTFSEHNRNAGIILKKH